MCDLSINCTVPVATAFLSFKSEGRGVRRRDLVREGGLEGGEEEWVGGGRVKQIGRKEGV